MVINKEKRYYKRLVITEDRINELDALLTKYCDIIIYEARTNTETTLSFESCEELLAYDNFKNGKIIGLDVLGKSIDDGIYIDIELAPELRIKRETASCRYEFADPDSETLFEKSWTIFLEKATEYQTSYVLCRIASFVFGLSLGVFLLIILFNTKAREISPMPLLIFLMGVFMNTITRAKSPWERIFPPAEFPWGEEKQKYLKQITRRGNMFWNVVIPTLLSIVFEIVSIIKIFGQ